MPVTDEMREKWDHRIEFICDHGEGHMTDWELDFIDSVSLARSRDKDLSTKRVTSLYQIYHKIEEAVG